MANELLSAQEQVLQGLDDWAAQNESDMAPVIQKIRDWIEKELAECEKQCNKISTKIKSGISRIQTANANDIEGVNSSVQSYLYNTVGDNEDTLTQMHVKAGSLPVGGKLDDLAKQSEKTKDPIQWGGQLLLDCKCLDSTTKEIIGVLGEIKCTLSTLCKTIGMLVESFTVAPHGTQRAEHAIDTIPDIDINALSIVWPKDTDSTLTS